MTMKLKKTGIALLSAMLVLGNVTPVMATQTAGTQQTTQTQSKTDTLQKEKEDAESKKKDFTSDFENQQEEVTEKESALSDEEIIGAIRKASEFMMKMEIHGNIKE